MSARGDHPSQYRFRLLQKPVPQARVQALVQAQVEVEVGEEEEEGVVVVVVQGSALECSWEEREAVPVPELAVLC